MHVWSISDTRARPPNADNAALWVLAHTGRPMALVVPSLKSSHHNLVDRVKLTNTFQSHFYCFGGNTVTEWDANKDVDACEIVELVKYAAYSCIVELRCDELHLKPGALSFMICWVSWVVFSHMSCAKSFQLHWYFWSNLDWLLCKD